MTVPVHRLPRRVHLGKGYVVEVVLVGPRKLAELLDEDDTVYDGFFESSFGDGKVAGRICINSRLPIAKKWATYWHELIHAVNDISAFDNQPGGLIT